MSGAEQRFIHELEREIENHPDKQDIIAEYRLHIYELLQEESVDKENIYNELVERLGTPLDIAQIWQQELGATPRKMQWLFVFLNISIFIGGFFLVLGYNVFHWSWMERLWSGLTEVPVIIMFIYILFWGLLGYEIGKEFGHGGYKILNRTFIISVIPNFILMYLIVFKVFPYEWFQPLLSAPFIVTCIIFTGLLYPVSWLGYRWGRKVSI